MPYPDLNWSEPTPAPGETGEWPPRRYRLGVVLAAVGLVAVVTAFGLVVGFLWSELAPRLPLVMVEGGIAYAHPEPEEAIGADGWFAILGLAAGAVLAVLAWFVLRRIRGPVILGALVVGSIAGALLGWWAWRDPITLAEFAQTQNNLPVGAAVPGPLDLRVTGRAPGEAWRPTIVGVIPLQALAAAFVYTCLAGFSASGSLRPARWTQTEEGTGESSVRTGPHW
jgi:hypothetical protein